MDASNSQLCNGVSQTVHFADYSNLHVLSTWEDKVKSEANEPVRRHFEVPVDHFIQWEVDKENIFVSHVKAALNWRSLLLGYHERVYKILQWAIQTQSNQKD